MPLILKRVEPGSGARWLRDAFALYARRPLAFTLMFVVFLFAALALSLVPFVGALLQMMSLPLLSLGFMVASQSALLDGPVRPSQFVVALQGDPARRRSLAILCLLYGCAAIAILLLCDQISGGAMEHLQTLLAAGPVAPEEIDELLSDRSVSAAMLTGVVLATLLSVPFWHAPALVHWGAQGVGQALFSSTLAVWRSKGAFFVYALAWSGIVIGFGALAAIVFGLLGMGQLGSLIALPAGLMFSTVFYVSLLFTFNDSFGGAEAPPRIGS